MQSTGDRELSAQCAQWLGHESSWSSPPLCTPLIPPLLVVCICKHGVPTCICALIVMPRRRRRCTARYHTRARTHTATHARTHPHTGVPTCPTCPPSAHLCIRPHLHALLHASCPHVRMPCLSASARPLACPPVRPPFCSSIRSSAVHPATHPSLYPTAHLSALLCIYPPTHPPVCRPACSPARPPARPPNCPSICPSTRPPTRPLAHLPTALSVPPTPPTLPRLPACVSVCH